MNKRLVGVLLGAFLLVSGASSLSAATIWGTKWGPQVYGTGATVTWSFMETGVCCDEDWGEPFVALADFMPVGFDTAIRAAFAAWSAVADILFVEVPDGGEDFNALVGLSDIRIGGAYIDGPENTLAYGYYPPPNGDSAAGDIAFDVEEIWQLGFAGPGFDIFQVAAHEIGHAIGLKHTKVPGSLMNPYYTQDLSGPQKDDIRGARFLYGPFVQPVPVPATLPLLLTGMVLIGAVCRRRKRV